MPSLTFAGVSQPFAHFLWELLDDMHERLEREICLWLLVPKLFAIYLDFWLLTPLDPTTMSCMFVSGVGSLACNLSETNVWMSLFGKNRWWGK